MKNLLRSASEHRPVACTPSGDFLRCRRSSGLQTRWAHRLKVYVPMCALAYAFLTSPVLAQADSDFARANQEYAQGHFKDAIAGYEGLVRTGQATANVFYDLGNAYFRTADFGGAILNYQRALALERHHPEATANLQIARDEAHALEMQPGRAERYLHFASVNQYTITAAVSFWIAVLCLAASIFARRRSAAMVALLLVMLLVFTGAIFATWQLERGSKGSALAIVIGKDVRARLA